MKTRNLIILSICCGLMIVLAGGFKLFQVATDRTEVPVNKLGVAATIGDMSATVTLIDESTEGISVAIEMSGVAGDSVIDGWRLLGDGKVLEPSGAVLDGACDASTKVPDTGASIQCFLRFPAVKAVQAVAYTRAGEQRQWGP
ncbi:MAG: hypothetical protein F2780_08870 [Actinobacteria bacterium]|jgi:hypothetical protein|uniref:Unannotated protein n=1 Tax=freshwater metagenome TaxID=449393 RepID=A0A6J7EL70_9ZZZZ|nr:hypothetical protein [Actinomycetota bacterium]